MKNEYIYKIVLNDYDGDTVFVFSNEKQMNEKEFKKLCNLLISDIINETLDKNKEDRFLCPFIIFSDLKDKLSSHGFKEADSINISYKYPLNAKEYKKEFNLNSETFDKVEDDFLENWS